MTTIDVVSRLDASVIKQLPMASPDDVTEAYRRADEALPAWREMAAADRAAIFLRAAVLFR